MRWQPSVLSVAALVALFAPAGLFPQAGAPPASTRMFSSQVYAWFPDNTVRRLSPGPASSASAAMPAGPFAQSVVHPAGTAAVFWGGLGARPRLWIYDFAARSVRPLTADNVGSVEPSFDWQGRRIVFAADTVPASAADLAAAQGSWRRSTSNIFIVDADGTNLRQVTDGAFQDSRPAFSPDGTDIVFLSNRGGKRGQLYVAPVDHSAQPRRLLDESVIVRPWYSADGKFIYFTYASLIFEEDQIRIWRIPATANNEPGVLKVYGGAIEPITPTGFPNSQGLFVDPDGVHLWFHSNSSERPNLPTNGPYRFNLETKELTRMMPPGFKSAHHLTRSRNGVITFDSTDPEPIVRQ